jgi:signal transduction histidine kinase
MKNHPPISERVFPLQIVLIVPFVMQLFGAVGLVGYVSFKNGEKAVNDLADQLIEKTNREVNFHLDTYLSIPPLITQLNADAIRLGTLNVNDRKTVGKVFWHQMQAYNLSYISLNLATGTGAGAARYDGKTVTIDDTAVRTPSLLNNNTTYQTDDKGNVTQVMATSPWDTLNEVAYTTPVKAGKPTWRIYGFYDPSYPPYIVAASGRPVYDDDNKLIGTVGAEIHLLKLNDFLKDSGIGEAGQVFIMERDGTLVASSTQEQPFKIEDSEIKRLKAIDSPNSLLQATTQQIQQRFALEAIDKRQELITHFQGNTYHVNVQPWKDDYGLDWLIATSISEDYFMAQINANTRTSVLLCLAALVCATVIGVVTSKWITRSIVSLNEASQAMASGDLEQTVGKRNIKELNLLAQSFNHMAKQLRESFMALAANNAALEDRVEERTVELKSTLSELQRTQAQMLQSEKMSSLGQLVAGVAHEINNPVNFIHGNLTHVQNYIQDLLDFVQLYQLHHPSPAVAIQTKAEEIDLSFIQEDLPNTLSSMRIGTDRIRAIVLSLRNFSRLDESDSKPADIHEGLDSTLLILQHRIKKQSAQQEIEIIRDYGVLPLVECYPGLLNQVFMNILSNAIDAIEEKNQKQTVQNKLDQNKLDQNKLDQNKLEQPSQITIRTTVSNQSHLQWAQIAIADNGCGISEEVQKRIFDPFFTTKAVGKGTGMGMSISYQIVVEKHQGKLECFSTTEQGTEFLIQIPIQQAARSQ